MGILIFGQKETGAKRVAMAKALRVQVRRNSKRYPATLAFLYPTNDA